MLVLWALCPLMFLNTDAWSTNENTNTLAKEDYNCTMSITATPIGVYCGETTGQIEVKITGGTAPYKIEWDNNDSSIWAEITTNESTYTIPDLPRGMYLVKVRDANGCRDMIMNIMMDDNASDLTYTVEPSDPCVAEGSFVIRVRGSNAPYWVILDGPTSGGVLANNNDFRIDNLLPGNYKITVDKDGCGHTQYATLITTPVALSASAVVEDNNECDSFGDVQLNITGGTSEYLISWYGASAGSTRSTGSKLIQNLTPGDYTFTVRDHNFCTTSTTATVTSTGSDLYCVLTQTPAICDNMGQIGVAIKGGKPGYTVTYSGPVSGSVSANSRDSNSGDASVLDLPPGQYQITVSDSRGCSATESITVGGEIKDLTCIVTQAPVLCDNMGQIGVAITGGHPSFRIDYTGPISGAVIATNTGARTATGTILDLPPGYYTIVVTDSRGCTATESITVDGSVSDLACIVTQTPVLCDNMGQIGVAINGGEPTYRVDYSGPRTGSIIGTTTGAKAGTASILDLPAGYYTIVVTDSRGCSATESITVGGSITDLACILTQTPQICDNMGTIGVSISGGQPAYRVEYSGPSSGSVIATTTGDRAGTAGISGLSPGYYKITVIDSRGCSASENIAVGGGPSDMVSHIAVQPAICTSNSGVDVAVTGGTPSYSISYTGPVSGTITSSTGGTMFIPLPLGTYTITVVDANGCSATETAIVGQGVNDLHCRLVKTHAICHKKGSIEVIIIGGKPGFTVKWQTGHGENVGYSEGYNYIFEVPCPGKYDVTIIDANGCVVMESTEIRQLENNLAYELFANPGVQEGNGWIEAYFQAGQAPYTIELTGPSVQTVIANGPIVLSSLPSGNYSVNIIDANGCDKQTYITIPKVGESDEDAPLDGMRISFENNEDLLQSDVKKTTTEKGAETTTELNIPQMDNGISSDKFEVYQNYPNPFKDNTTLSFNLPKAAKVTITVHDHFGKTIEVIQRDFAKGKNQHIFERSDLGSGIYYFTVTFGTNTKTTRMLHIE